VVLYRNEEDSATGTGTMLRAEEWRSLLGARRMELEQSKYGDAQHLRGAQKILEYSVSLCVECRV
jgi:hypothetical protein